MATTLADQLAIEQTGPDEFVSKTLPERMGNALPIAYGGCALAVATHAAYKTVSPSYSLYSLVGHYLGPASTQQHLHCTVQATRDTRTFATRRVQVSQIQPDGTKRICLDLLADFQVEEPALLEYSAPPMRKYSSPEDSPSLEDIRERAVAAGKLDRRGAESFKHAFYLMEGFFDSRLCPEGISNQNLVGYLKNETTTQDHLPITDKSSADWVQLRVPLASRGERMAAVSFLTDGAIAFTPLTHNHMYLQDSAATSSLDFALRIFVPDIDLSSWHLRERRTMAAAYGRNFSEGRLWDRDGRMVASMTQQSIMRPKKNQPSKASL